jgi:hypothetical protein
MLLKLIVCEVFTREVCHCVASSPHVVDLEFTPKGAHNEPAFLRKLLQGRIDAANASEKNYDAVVLGLGLCGNATVGLVSHGAPLVIPRAHDCCTLFLGSKERMLEHFGDSPSQAFSSAGYLEHGGDFVREAEGVREQTGYDLPFEAFVEQYGEENAKYLWETLHPNYPQDGRVVFIEVPEFKHLGYAETCRRKAEAEGKKFAVVEGSMELVQKLVNGDWNRDEFLVLQPGEAITAVYDHDEVVRAARPDGGGASGV